VTKKREVIVIGHLLLEESVLEAHTKIHLGLQAQFSLAVELHSLQLKPLQLHDLLL